jgi:hypothetical protein
MVQFNELRIGSWILEDGRPIKVTAIEYGSEPYCRINETIASKKDMAEIFESIPITSEFLKAVGFVSLADQPRLTMSLEAQNNLYYSQSSKQFQINEQQLPKSPSYVHQFQNLYLCFTGQDLEIVL